MCRMWGLLGETLQAVYTHCEVSLAEGDSMQIRPVFIHQSIIISSCGLNRENRVWQGLNLDNTKMYLVLFFLSFFCCCYESSLAFCLAVH